MPGDTSANLWIKYQGSRIFYQDISQAMNMEGCATADICLTNLPYLFLFSVCTHMLMKHNCWNVHVSIILFFLLSIGEGAQLSDSPETRQLTFFRNSCSQFATISICSIIKVNNGIPSTKSSRVSVLIADWSKNILPESSADCCFGKCWVASLMEWYEWWSRFKPVLLKIVTLLTY